MKKFAFLTDIHLDEDFPKTYGVDARKNWLRLLQDVQDRGVEALIFGGDIGAPESNAWFFESLRETGLPVYPILGNHDTRAEASRHFPIHLLASKPETWYYSFDDDHYRYIFLDSSEEKIEDVQRAWFVAQLDTSKTVLLFVHHPVFPVDTLIDGMHPLHGREYLQDCLLERNANTFIFCGHYHMEEVTVMPRIQQLISPAGAFQIIKTADPIGIDASSFGYRILSIHPHRVDTEVITFSPTAD
jgi:3',5'-cyclic-AMP phosphodiesterase